MKREIKFRAWDENGKYMSYQGEPDVETLTSFIYHYGDDTLMQFTGKKDYDGKEIYDGDILEDEHTKAKKVVQWDDEYCAYVLSCGDVHQWLSIISDIMPHRVFGNIYQNPELLNP